MKAKKILLVCTAFLLALSACGYGDEYYNSEEYKELQEVVEQAREDLETSQELRDILNEHYEKIEEQFGIDLNDN